MTRVQLVKWLATYHITIQTLTCYDGALWQDYKALGGLAHRAEIPTPYRERIYKALNQWLKDHPVAKITNGYVTIGDWVRGFTPEGEQICGEVVSVAPLRVKTYGRRITAICNASS